METQGASRILALTLMVLLLSGVSCDLIVTHAPGHVDFRPTSHSLAVSELPQVISSVFGFDVHKDISWNGLGVGDLFQRPKANMLVSIEGPAVKLNLPNVATYATEQDVDDLDTETIVYDILNIAEKNDKPLLVDLSMGSRALELKSHQPDLFRDVPSSMDKLQDLLTHGHGIFSTAEMGSLNISNEVDVNFLGELQVMQAILNALKQKGAEIHGRLPNFYHFRVRGLQKIAVTHGVNSIQYTDACKLLEKFITQMTTTLRALYADNVVVEIITLEQNLPRLNRKTRQLMEVDPTGTPPVDRDLNLSPEYTHMYPVIFNFILWIMIVLAVALIAIAYGIWFMDPGRDSIIYRMTSQRIKKD